MTLKGANPALPPISLQHLGHRWYDPSIGRFMQRDPIGLGGGLNLYVYLSGNPLVAVDPLGLRKQYEGDESVPPDRWFDDWIARNIILPIVQNTPLRGGYAGLSAGKGPVAAGAGGGWTIDHGFFFYCYFGPHTPSRPGSRGETFGGGFITYGEDGWSGGGMAGGSNGFVGNDEEGGFIWIGGTIPVGGVGGIDLGGYLY